jgi:hypothetical protein
MRVLYVSQQRQQLFFIRHELVGIYNMVESVYSAVQNNSLHKAEYILFFKVK